MVWTRSLAEMGEDGVVFYAKDLSNDDESMQVARASHKVTASLRSESAFTMGGRADDANHLWDGLIDDVRLSNSALRLEQLLLTSEALSERTVGYWQFETAATYFKDASGLGNDIRVKTAPPEAGPDPRAAALADFCHVLLNANEFLYVD